MKEKINLPTVSYLLDRRYKSVDDEYTVSLVITIKGKRSYYPITTLDEGEKIKLSISDFDSLGGSRGAKRKIKDRCDNVKADAQKVISEMSSFSIEKFEDKFFSDVEQEKDNVNGALRTKARQLREEGRLKTAIGYDTTANSIEAFSGKGVVSAHDITVAWLNAYEKHMLRPYYTPRTKKRKTRSLTSIGIYLRNLRHIIRPLLSAEDYPFGAGKYEIPTGRNIKKALCLADVGKIYNYPLPDGSDMQRYRDYWILSYLCNGMNMKDLARLKYSNIDSRLENITFIRSKTAATKRSKQQRISVPLTSEIGAILDRWKAPGSQEGYVLPILTPGLTQEQELTRIETVIRSINKTMREIAQNVGFKTDVTTYSARHSFATIMMQSGASIAMISKALGHSNVNTTESYLDDFDDETKRAFAAKLTAFAREPESVSPGFTSTKAGD
jgi:integrase/recombinase XerD